MALRIRRGTSAQRTTITPVSGELIFDTTQNKLYVGNGSTAGGVEVVAGQIGGNVGSNINLNGFDITGTGNINITGTITASGTITGNGDLVLGNADTDNVQFGADINSNIVPNVGTLTVGTSSKPWQTVYAGAIENTSGISSNSAVTLNGLVTVGNNIVPNTTKTKDLGTTALRWRNINAEKLSLENIEIYENEIRTTNSNSNINITPSGSGSVLLGGSSKIAGTADFGWGSPAGIRIESTQLSYNLNPNTGYCTSLNTSTQINYTQVAGSTQETFVLLTIDTAFVSGFVLTLHAINSQGADTSMVTGNIFSGNASISTQSNDVVNSSGIAIIDSVDSVAASGTNINIRVTTTNQINLGVVTTFKVYATLFTSNY
jgi:hypothetical protein